MTGERKVLLAVSAVVVLVFVAIFFGGEVTETLAPQAVAAWVAIEPAGSGVAEIGPVEIEAGTPFTLRAVLEARTRTGGTVFYTEAPALSRGGQPVEGEIRKWEGPETAQVLWFTVENPSPYIELDDPQGWQGPVYGDLFRPDWPRTWSIPGSVESARRRLATEEALGRPAPFGVQRYHVRIELYGPESRIRPRRRIKSAAADALMDHLDTFPMVIAGLRGKLAAPSAVFGLPQVEAAIEGTIPSESMVDAFRHHLSFSRAMVLQTTLEGAGTSWEELRWQEVDLAAGQPAWQPGEIGAGDLLRVASRVVVLLQDQGQRGVLDYADLCLDFLRGASVRPLREVFSGEGLVESAELAAGGGGGA